MRAMYIKATALLAASLVLVGCGSIKKDILAGEAAINMERLVEEHNIQQALFISYEKTEKGIEPKMIVVDTNTGKLIPPCGEVKCRSPFDFPREKEGAPVNSAVKILGESAYIVRVWEGSTCTTLYSYVTGMEYEICSPPYPKFWRP